MIFGMSTVSWSGGMGDEITGRKILALPMQENDAGAKTIGGYLIALLVKLWEEDEGFSGKRPFGNSGWSHDLYRPIISAGLTGSLDSNGYVKDKGDADALIFDAINALFPAEETGVELAHAIAAKVLRDAADKFDNDITA